MACSLGPEIRARLEEQPPEAVVAVPYGDAIHSYTSRNDTHWFDFLRLHEQEVGAEPGRCLPRDDCLNSSSATRPEYRRS